MTFSKWDREFFLSEESGLCDLINWSHYRATDRQTYWLLPVGIWVEIWSQRRGEQMEPGSSDGQGPHTGTSWWGAGHVYYPKLRKIRVSAVGKVTSINQLLHYGRNEPCGLGVQEGVWSPHTLQVATQKGACLSHCQKEDERAFCGVGGVGLLGEIQWMIRSLFSSTFILSKLLHECHT